MKKEIIHVVLPGDQWLLDALTEADKKKVDTGEIEIVKCRYVEEGIVTGGQGIDCCATRITLVRIND